MISLPLLTHAAGFSSGRIAYTHDISLYVAVLVLSVALGSGCAPFAGNERNLSKPGAVTSEDDPLSEIADTSAIKLHMPDLSVYVLRNWRIDADQRTVAGTGAHLDLNRDTLDVGPITVPIDSVSLFETNVRAPSRAAGVMGAVSVASLALTTVCIVNPKTCFGSCPTIYSESDGQYELEAESFSHSIVPLFEMRDVDRLAATPDSKGSLELQVRNEALETHYMNHLELIEVNHRADEFAVPDGQGGALLLRDLETPDRITDRAGNRLTETLATADTNIFETDPKTVRRATSEKMNDHIDVSVPTPRRDTAAVLLRLRNSLLPTVLFYDFFLGGQGLQSINWLDNELHQIGRAVELGEFYHRRMGLRVSVFRDGAFEEVDRIGGVGPIAWDEVAALVPVPERDSLRIRLSFLSDAWRIDRLAVTPHVRRSDVRHIPVEEIELTRSTLDSTARRQVAEADEAYFTTYPGTQYRARFAASPPPENGSRTYFIAAQGYYIEWIRENWLEATPRKTPIASDQTLLDALDKWQSVKPEFERQFFETAVPVR